MGDKAYPSFNAALTPDGRDFDAASKAREAAYKKQLGGAIKAAGYPAKADSTQINKPMVVLLLFILVLYVTMVYGPIAAMLVEMFPTRIRYSSMSLPYHIGNGWFGGLLPDLRLRAGGGQGQHLLRAVVSDHRGTADLRHRQHLRARDQGRQHLRAGQVKTGPHAGYLHGGWPVLSSRACISAMVTALGDALGDAVGDALGDASDQSSTGKPPAPRRGTV